MNRDYFTKPIQNSRSAYDYGRSGSIEPMHTPVGMGWASYVVGAVVLVLVFFAWIS